MQNHGRPILKVHLLLCVFHGKITLCVDAIETPIWMREFISNNNIKWSENKNRDPLFDYRFEILDRVISIIKWIAWDIWVETLLIEEYSNTTWVRDALQKYKQVHFYIHELREIYDGEIVDSIFYNLTWWIALSGKKKEIQLLNSELQDKWLKNGINSARIILWSTPVIPNPFRGI